VEESCVDEKILKWVGILIYWGRAVERLSSEWRSAAVPVNIGGQWRAAVNTVDQWQSAINRFDHWRTSVNIVD
jgi:hypothetical protein